MAQIPSSIFFQSYVLIDHRVREVEQPGVTPGTNSPILGCPHPDVMNPVDHLNAALVGRYEIGREIGAGGMATVYLARDLRHNRSVALKLLNPELGAVLGSDRFLSEIQVTANLQHPNLLPLFDSGDADGLLFYVMPYIAGESLRARLMREKQLPVDEAVHVAVAIASALDYAHRQGVVHRDLKPENILLHEDQPLIADFGIALAVSRAGGNRITQTGLSLGTPQYMSPEQATGDRSVDGRTDIYSLGAMLYEMLVGDPPYTGSTTQAIIAKVITERPRRVRLSRDSVPVHVDAAIDCALAKLPADRWHTAHQFADALRGKAVALPSSAPTHAAAERESAGVLGRLKTSPLAWAAALIVAVAITAWERNRRELPDAAPVRFALSLMPSERLAVSVAQPITISPDGRRIVYVGARQLYVRDLDRLQTRALAGTENAISPAVSPDGRWVAFTSLGKLKKVPIDGGPATVLSDATGPAGVSWLSTGELVLAKQNRSSNTTLWRVPADGGDPQLLAPLDSASGERYQWYPHAYARERLVLYTSLGRAGVSGPRLAAFSLKTGKTTQLGIEGTYVLGVALGQLIYVRSDGALMAVPFDAQRIRVTGSSIPLAEGVQVQTVAAAAAVSPTGTLVYLHGASTSQVVLVDEHGASRTLLEEKRRYLHPRYSPDGSRIAFDVASAQATDVWVADLASGTFTRLTTTGNSDRPEWSPDGKRIVFLANRDTSSAPWGVWWQPADGSAPAERIFAGNYDIREAILTPDGRSIVYREDNTQSRADIMLLPLDTPRVPRPLLTSQFDEMLPRVSPDGRWLAYTSDESGQTEVYVVPFPAVSGRFQVSVGGGSEPLWSPDGTRLFYRNSAQVIAVTIARQNAEAPPEHDDAGLSAERQRPGAESRSPLTITGRTTLFEADYSTHPWHPNYDVAPGGKHFVMLRPSTDETQLIVVVNWVDELRRRIAETP